MTSQLCAFCGNDDSDERLTTEHFVPRALWDGARPPYTRTVPVHDTCNRHFSGDNEYFRDVLVMEDGAKAHPEVQKLLKGKIKRKIHKRPGAIKNALKNLQMREVRTPGGLYLGHAPSFSMDWPRIRRVLQNVMKGIFYSVQNRPLSADTVYQVVPIESQEDERALADLEPLIAQMNPWVGFGDDVFACRYVFEEKAGDVLLCFMQFYRHRIFMGSAISKVVSDLAAAKAREPFGHEQK
ncbi:MAG TPA: hypothetical protein VFE62_20400 [Gemmataceae bacterium]|nr:hypothetical protein [Gemmataceae bacterium]